VAVPTGVSLVRSVVMSMALMADLSRGLQSARLVAFSKTPWVARSMTERRAASVNAVATLTLCSMMGINLHTDERLVKARKEDPQSSALL